MKEIFVLENISIRQAMKILNSNPEKCLLVINNDEKLLGTLTDGDIRRCILNGANASSNILNAYNKKPISLRKKNFNKEIAKELMLRKEITMLPVLNDKGIVIDYITSHVKKNENNSLKDISVVIMAGGKGTRLDPFTKVLPKPLVPINDKPIIEHIIESFTKLGVENFYLTLNYKGKILKAYFEELDPSYKINIINEKKPLGTGGGLKHLSSKFKEPFFVTNCDIMIKIDYSSLFEFHQNGEYDLTLVASSKEYIIQYGTCILNEKGHLSHINEKPKYDFLINTGLYILNPEMLKYIPNEKFYHITQLIEDAKKDKKKIGVFPIDDEAWIDVGEWAEYDKAIDKLK